MGYKNTADTMKVSAGTPGRAQKSPSRGGAGIGFMEYNNLKKVGESGVEEFTCTLGSGQFNPECPDALTRIADDVHQILRLLRRLSSTIESKD